MHNLRDILYTVSIADVKGDTAVQLNQIQFDSRQVQANDCFVAIRGTITDGHKYIDAAIAKGASSIICEEFPEKINNSVTYIKVNSAELAIAAMSANYFGHPSKDLKLIGVTGTNGKSTITTLLYKLYRKLGYKVGLISTIEYKVHDKTYNATHTTPDALKLNALLSEMVSEGCEYCFMEVSSHALAQNRVADIHFSGAVFTQLSHDHLDFHKDFADYIRAKKMLFDMLPEGAFALTNVDDKRGRVMVQNTKAKVHTYALNAMANYKLKIVENSFTGLHLDIEGIEFNSFLVGRFNAYNLLSVYATAELLGSDKMEVLQELSTIQTAEGRFDYIYDKNNGVIGIIDYAHTPDALKNVLSTIAEIRTGNETVITLVGCGGDRDKTKRPLMAEVACTYSDKVIFTSDNPRTEKVEDIIDDMMKGLSPVNAKKVIRINDRKEAIKTAYMIAQKGDIIGIYGKGHEKYIEVNGVRSPFDDKEILKETFQNAAS